MSGEIYIKRFNPIEELGLVNEWLEARGMPHTSARELPALGYIAYLEQKDADDLPVAAAFLRRVEGGWGMLEGLCTNPAAPAPARNLGIESVVKAILDRADSYGMTHIISWSIDSGTLERSKAHGFVRSDFVLITRRLTPP